MSTEDKYKDAFNQARDRYRIIGAGGVSMPSPAPPARNGAPQAETTPQTAASKNVFIQNGVVMIGGKNIKTKVAKDTDNSHYGILNYGPKEDKKDR